MTIRILNPTATDITVKEYKKKTTEYKGSHPYLQITAEAVNPDYRILLLPRKSTTPDPEIDIKRKSQKNTFKNNDNINEINELATKIGGNNCLDV